MLLARLVKDMNSQVKVIRLFTVRNGHHRHTPEQVTLCDVQLLCH
jgi:hypothetical protein